MKEKLRKLFDHTALKAATPQPSDTIPAHAPLTLPIPSTYSCPHYKTEANLYLPLASSKYQQISLKTPTIHRISNLGGSIASIQGHEQNHNDGDDEKDDEDDDDNMSSYSTISPQMIARGRPFNNSQRPLLAECKSQLLITATRTHNATNHKKKSSHQMAPIQTSNMTKSQTTQTQTQPQTQSKNYISVNVQQQKRLSQRCLHGFNDFNVLSQQYNQHLESTHNGYPYGNSSSATTNNTSPSCTDFIFEGIEKPMVPKDTVSTSLILSAKCNGGNNYGSMSLTTLRDIKSISDDRRDYTVKVNDDRVNKFGHFEDNFCSCSNKEFVENDVIHGRGAAIGKSSPHSGPFIFGLSPEKQTNCVSMAAKNSIVKQTFNATNIDIKQIYKNSNNYNNGIVKKFIDYKNEGKTEKANCETTRHGRRYPNRFFFKKCKSNRLTIDDGKCTKNLKKSTIKCVLVGDCAVGKTNLIISYLENRFNTNHVPTASDIYNADVMVNDSLVHLIICDTAGQDTLDPLRELCYPDSDVFLLCFSIAKPETFDAIKTKWAPKFAHSKASLLLIGTQADLRTNANHPNKYQSSNEHSVSYADACEVAANIGAKYIETSSVNHNKVKEAFDAAIWEGLAPTIEPPPSTSFWKGLFCLT